MVNNYDVAVLSEKVAYLEAAIKNAGIELPTVTSDDNGKTLQVIEGAWATGMLLPELPAVTGDDNGKTLQVSSGAWATGSKIPGVVNTLDSTSTTDALSAAQGKELDGKITGLIKTKTVTGTTLATGNLSLDLQSTTSIIVGLQNESGGYIVLPYIYNTNIYAHVLDTNLAIVSETNVSVVVSYIDK